MMQQEHSNKAVRCKRVCSSLMMLSMGLLSCSAAVALAYFTYQAAVGYRSFCTLWTDIPGRAAILVACYYVAGMCGYFPIPSRSRLDCFPEPFELWRLQSWRDLFENSCHCGVNRSPVGGPNSPSSSQTPLLTNNEGKSTGSSASVLIPPVSSNAGVKPISCVTQQGINEVPTEVMDYPSNSVSPLSDSVFLENRKTTKGPYLPEHVLPISQTEHESGEGVLSEQEERQIAEIGHLRCPLKLARNGITREVEQFHYYNLRIEELEFAEYRRKQRTKNGRRTTF